jgi:DNA-directed RNA polymerase specialized sigma24 family protein
MESSDPWAAYARAQKNADHYDVSDHTWAADEAAAEVIDLIARGIQSSEARENNLLTNRAAKFRRRRSIVNLNLIYISQPQSNIEDVISARSELIRVSRKCNPLTLRLLIAIADGASYREAGTELGIPEATAKTRVRRARLQLAA